MESKSNKIDLIYNLNTDIWNQEALMYEPKEESNLYLGTKEAIGPIIFEKNIGAILTVMDSKSYVKEQIK